VEHVLSATDDGRHLPARRGDVVVVRLPESGGTGFLWELVAPAGVALLESEPEPAPPGSGIGATGLRRFVVGVDAEGTHELRARLRQPWQPDDVAGTWTVTVEVS